MWYIHIMKYYSAIKRNVVLTCAVTWMNLENMLRNKPDIKSHMFYGSIYMKCVE